MVCLSFVEEPWLRARPYHPVSVLDLTITLWLNGSKIPAAGSMSGGKTETRGVVVVL